MTRHVTLQKAECAFLCELEDSTLHRLLKKHRKYEDVGNPNDELCMNCASKAARAVTNSLGTLCSMCEKIKLDAVRRHALENDEHVCKDCWKNYQVKEAVVMCLGQFNLTDDDEGLWKTIQQLYDNYVVQNGSSPLRWRKAPYAFKRNRTQAVESEQV